MFNIVYRLEQLFRSIPPEVERQQPIHLIDAFGRHCPFYLEFVRSSEVNFFIVLRGYAALNHSGFTRCAPRELGESRSRSPKV